MMRIVGSSALDVLSHLPYFKGKGLAALAILELCKRTLPLTIRLPNGARMWISDDNAGQMLLPYWIGKVERQVSIIFQRCLSRLHEGESVVDGGANVGFYSIMAAQHLRQRGGGAVFAFEPNPYAFARLQSNALLNRFDYLVATQQALGDANGELPLYLYPGGITFGSLRQFQPYLTESVRVKVSTLDQFLAEHSASRIGLMKIDIEGGELPALRGARYRLEHDRPMIIYEEYDLADRAFGYTTPELRAYLQSFGYRLYRIGPRGLFNARLIPLTDYLMAPEGSHQDILAMPGDEQL